MRVQRKLKNQTDKIRPDTEITKIHHSLLKKKLFVDETNQTSIAKSYSYKRNFNAKTDSCSEASSSEEEDIGIRKSRRKSDFENTNKELNGSSSEEEEIK